MKILLLLSAVLLGVTLGITPLELTRNQLLAMGYKDARPELDALHSGPSPQVFKWQNCGSTSDPTKIESLSVSPDPIVLGSNVTVSFKGEISMDVTNSTDVQVALVIEKEVLGVWVEIPCLDNVGSCTYPSLCALFKNYGKPCNPIVPKDIPCHCPFKQGTYQAGPLTIPTKNPHESWLTDGEYKVSATLSYNSKRLVCAEVIASLSATLDSFENMIQ